ncbi:nitronate monooxygenase family protein [Acidithiobacillus sp.]|uniref:NAD(P)H-dependent flavin oxidoreductase n=1 Tax=Acidithiobacillus sp. TaxID=1872118 RepID=UPI0025C2CE78|nr:nitronate monooxygenase family protein [Acidithiobacillus sp.]MCK9188027.1 nitronate monooxygenase family protein [Acidithiobacillus sp.]MCK9359987.1 nitronate monooxygenase family protein [Acidithiobacillus sp.]
MDFPYLRIKGRSLLPVIQGGMGIGVSAHRLAGAVAAEGAIGTIASVELRRLHEDLMRHLRRLRDPEASARANLVALDREIQEARRIAGREGFIAVNVMHAISGYREHVLQAIKSGVNAVIVGAGLPMDLPMLAAEFPKVALIPILSEARGVQVVLRRWMRQQRLPDAIVIENPQFAGGHLGATRLEDVSDPKYGFANVLPAIRRLIEELGLKPDQIPLVAAGGISSFQKIREIFALGGSGVQLGTPFAVTTEGDAHVNFKRVLADATPKDLVTFMSSAGLPARAVLTPWLRRYLGREEKLRACASQDRSQCPSQTECLVHCGFKDGNSSSGQFCIEAQLAAAQRGDVQHGLFFRGAGQLPFGQQIRSVRDLFSTLLHDAAWTTREECMPEMAV